MGGHVEPGECPIDALRRECREELGITVVATGESHRRSIGEADLTIFRVERWRGEASNAAPEEHQAIGWFTEAEVARLPLADPGLLGLATQVLRGS